MSHALWSGVIRHQPYNPLVLDQQIHYVRGYILALEDLIEDLNEVYGLHSFTDIRRRTLASLRSAQATLAVLLDMEVGSPDPFTLAELGSEADSGDGTARG